MAWAALAFSAVSAVSEGANENSRAISEANQMRARATAVAASSQRAAQEERRQADLLKSRAIAVAAASGGTVDSGSVTAILGDIGAEGEYRALSRLWEGDDEATGIQFGAGVRESEGRAARTAGYLNAAGTVFSGMTSMKGKYGKTKVPKVKGSSATSTRQGTLSSRNYA